MCQPRPTPRGSERGWPLGVSSRLERRNGENWLAAPITIAGCSTALPGALLRTEDAQLVVGRPSGASANILACEIVEPENLPYTTSTNDNRRSSWKAIGWTSKPLRKP